LGDNGWESDQTFQLVVSNVQNALTGNNPDITVTGTITNDDARPVHIVVTLTLQGNLTDFVDEDFIDAISKVLGIDPSRITIRSKAAGSVIVVFAIEDTEGSPADTIIDDLLSKIESDHPSLESNGLIVLDVQLTEDPSPPSDNTEKEKSKDGSLSSGAIAAIIVVPLACIFFVILALAIFRYRNNHKHDDVDHNSVEMGVRKRTTSLPKTGQSKDSAGKGAPAAAKKKDDSEDSQTDDTDETDTDDSSANSKSSGSTGSTDSSEETDDSDDSDDSEEFSDSGSDETDSSSGNDRKKK